jgi:hypothetical protein
MSRKGMFIMRISEEKLADFKIVAELRGATMSGLVHQWIVKAIHEEKESRPGAFTQKVGSTVKAVKGGRISAKQKKAA